MHGEENNKQQQKNVFNPNTHLQNHHLPQLEMVVPVSFISWRGQFIDSLGAERKRTSPNHHVVTCGWSIYLNSRSVPRFSFTPGREGSRISKHVLFFCLIFRGKWSGVENPRLQRGVYACRRSRINCNHIISCPGTVGRRPSLPRQLEGCGKVALYVFPENGLFVRRTKVEAGRQCPPSAARSFVHCAWAVRGIVRAIPFAWL